MLFTSSEFFILFCTTFILYYIPFLRRSQISILISASFVFYAWSMPALLLLLLLSILINGVTSYQVAYTAKQHERLIWATLGVAANLALLGLFKYAGLLTSLFLDIFRVVETPTEGMVYMLLHLPLPIGISFYTFEGISLVMDVLRGRNRVIDGDAAQPSYVDRNLARHMAKTSFFISFFPQLIAGPVIRANSFYPQMAPKYLHEVDWNLVFRSLVVGYFLKMFVADNLKDYTFWLHYPTYQSMGTLTNLALLFGYSMQIFADFAGYSLIAIGLAASFGYTLMQNFNFPYISRSITEFWRRWHISLSAWLRDYLYIPLGGNKKGKARTYVNLMIVMALGGIWHGAAWSYAVWGVFHGVGLAVERFLGVRERIVVSAAQRPFWRSLLVDSLRVGATFTFVSVGWVLFKLTDFRLALDFLYILFTGFDVRPSLSRIVPVLLFSLPVVLYHLPHFPTIRERIAQHQTTWPAFAWRTVQDVALGVMLALLLLNAGSSQAFIYFQF
ncbi:MAG: hypothetical protein MI924_14070 [Chloroflexales bacterium]|nr:hypothetical protein [Chloroflexales bacterium]